MSNKRPRIIGLDPGSPNFGATIFKYKNNKEPFILKTGILPITISNIKHENHSKKGQTFGPVEDQIEEFDNFVVSLLDKYEPDLVGIERFQGRGLRGNLSELVILMISTWALRCGERNIPYRLAAPISWKTQFDKQNPSKPLKDVYSEATMYGIPNHCIDSTLIGDYCWAQYCGSKNNFQKYKDNENFRRLLEKLADATI